ncbi:MAG: Apolipoprotein A1/A4/E domain [Marinobacter excellens HL-55]|uniref:Apolipoprotein A1/A4/E domain n=1 Tax=Marinobacter excellens HL-55 TaxID=1305731 RepID=A0A0P7ZEB5_9GAMM|nr:MAG: Apolipoprotein A1/A4/E domain [Marinobacter excellens HL-55]
MSRLFFTLAFAIGMAVAAWIGAGFIGSDLLALAFTGLIAAVYCLGFGELVNFRKQTQQLAGSVDQLPESHDRIASWLATLPQSMQFAVHRRIEGQAAALPGPQLTPYLTGLLVMLGLLGTFAGMIVTLGGAASALDNSTELSAIRSALAAPIAGLSLAFGTSIAGVAASAMLGLASTLSRRDRLQASRTLDTALREKLHHLSADHQRQQAFQALETQARALPEMASAMERMTTRMEQLGQQLEQSLTRNQQEFHSAVGSHYQTLADSVAQSLKTALDDSSKQAAERVEPIVTQAMEHLQKDARTLQQSWSDDARQQLAELTAGFQKTTSEAGERWQQNLNEQQQLNARILETLEQRSQQSQHQLLEQLKTWASDITRQQQIGLTEQQQQLAESAGHLKSSSAELVESQRAGIEQLVATIGKQLSELREQEARRTDASAARMESLEATVAKHLAELGTALEAPMTRLIETASETPKAAAEVIRQLQSEIAHNSERENELLEERQRLVQELDSLLESQRSTADSQRDAVDALISGAGETLTGISERFNTLIHEQSQQLGKLGVDITGSSQEVGALSDAFAQAIELFSQSNQQVIASLADIQKALDSAGTRHDEQLAYYVAQAREVIDLSVSAQKDVIDAAAALRRAEPSEAG